ncbi:MAG: queuosine precursor transporter [Alphaproteobacteria bacterium]|nr:queuosine precursor transporter [Alphaproteobacteria bacterium]
MAPDPLHLIRFLHTWPTEAVLSLTFITCCLSLYGFARFFGKSGLYVYGILALVVGNIQVLKGVLFSFSQTPIALGTLVFSSTFVASDILTECYGKKAALKGVWLGFGAMLLVTILMLLTLGIHPLDVPPTHADYHFLEAHRAMEVLFLPAPRLLLASLTAYLCSQCLDITIFAGLKTSRTNALWARATFSTALAFLVDNALFSVLAWVVLSPTPVSWDSLLWTYILGTYWIRLLVGLLFLPLLSLICRQLKGPPHVELS